MLRHTRQLRQLGLAVRRYSQGVIKPQDEHPTVAKPKNASSIPQDQNVGRPQAPNRVDTWTEAQNPRSEAMHGPRFIQRDFDLQPVPEAAIELIAKEPIRFLDTNVAVCDGGSRPSQGHPKIFINLDKPGGVRYAHESSRAELEAAGEPTQKKTP